MSYLPDTTEKYNTPLYAGTMGEKAETNKNNGYYDKILSGIEEHDCLELQCYDFCIEDVECFFDNIDDNAEEFIDVGMDAVNKIAPKIKECLIDWLAEQRNEFAISLIENMDDEKYKENYKKIFGEDLKE